jgi:phage recombination protein Bet
MNTALATKKEQSLTINETELLNVLRNSLYPGAQDESIKLVISYCKASHLDPMQKPVHIVPMWDGKLKAMKDVIMPGIGLYRTQASRSDQYAGVSEPEFGDDVTETLSGVTVTFPKWCKVTVKRLLKNGAMADFTVKEFWKENYAVKGGQEKSIAPNAMWLKRPYAQIAKCAEAQALRKAFPEIGAQPTADEMEGKMDEYIDGQTGEIIPKQKPVYEKPALEIYPDDKFQKNKAVWKGLIESGKQSAEAIIKTVSTKGVLTDAQIQEIKQMEVIEGELS